MQSVRMKGLSSLPGFCSSFAVLHLSHSSRLKSYSFPLFHSYYQTCSTPTVLYPLSVQQKKGEGILSHERGTSYNIIHFLLSSSL